MIINKLTKLKSIDVINDRYFIVNKYDLDLLSDLLEYSKISNYDFSLYEKIYKNIINDMDLIFDYYYKFQDKIEEMFYPDESFYYLIINISKIYHLLDMGRYFLDKWYNSDDKIVRKIPNIFNKNYLSDDDYIYVGSFLKKIYINDIFKLVELVSIDLKDYELYYFFAVLCIIINIDWTSMFDVKKLINYVYNVYKYLLNEYKKNEKEDKESFE